MFYKININNIKMSNKEVSGQTLKINNENPAPIETETQKVNKPSDIQESKGEIIKSKKEIKYGETPYRWFFLVSYCLSGFVNQMQWVAYSAILTSFSDNYEKPLWKVNMFSLIFMIVYPITCIPEAWMLDKFSIRISLILVAACNIIGAGLKLLVNKDKSLASCYIGQIIACVFQPVLLNSPGKIAANWFREDIRTVICTICCLAVTTGALVGFLWNIIFVDEDEEKDKYKDQVFNYFLSEFILNVVFCVPTFFITKDKPDIPPSPSQEDTQEKAPGLVESFKLLFTNKRFLYLLASYALVVCYFDTMSTIINSLLDLYTITGSQSSVIYAVASVVGMVASLIISRILDIFKAFKLIMILLAVSGAVFQALFTLLLELIESKDLNAYAMGIIMYSLINISIISFYTIGMNYACEITYPVGESINGSIMASMPQILSIALTFLCDHFINNYEDKKWISNIILLILLVLSIVFTCLFDKKLDRQEVEQTGRIKEQEQNENKDKNENDVIEVNNNKK